MAVSLRESVERVSDPRNLDASVEEVFRLMLGVECQREAGPAVIESETVTAVVGFGGMLSGACVFRSGARSGLEDCRPYDRHGFCGDRRYGQGRHRRDL